MTDLATFLAAMAALALSMRAWWQFVDAWAARRRPVFDDRVGRWSMPHPLPVTTPSLPLGGRAGRLVPLPERRPPAALPVVGPPI